MQDNKQPTNQPTSTASLVPNIVKEIPIAAQNSKLRPVNEDDELDNIMRDVGHDIKQVGKKPPKHHWFDSQKKEKAEAKFSARPVESVKASPAAPPAPKTIAVAPGPTSTTPLTAAKPAAQVKTKPAKTSQAPVGVVILAMFVTVGLIAAAYYAYK